MDFLCVVYIHIFYCLIEKHYSKHQLGTGKVGKVVQCITYLVGKLSLKPEKRSWSLSPSFLSCLILPYSGLVNSIRRERERERDRQRETYSADGQRQTYLSVYLPVFGINT